MDDIFLDLGNAGVRVLWLSHTHKHEHARVWLQAYSRFCTAARYLAAPIRLQNTHSIRDVTSGYVPPLHYVQLFQFEVVVISYATPARKGETDQVLFGYVPLHGYIRACNRCSRVRQTT